MTQKFSQFITEEPKEQKYKLVIFHNSHENLRDVGKQDRPDVKLMNDAAKKVVMSKKRMVKHLSTLLHLTKLEKQLNLVRTVKQNIKNHLRLVQKIH